MTPWQAFEVYNEAGPSKADEAMAGLNALLNDDPNDAETLIYAARIQFDAGRFGMSDALLRRALSIQPANSNAWIELGRTQHSMQKSEIAAKYFSNALRIAGDRFNPYANLMLMNMTLGRPEIALEMAPIARFLCEDDDGAADLNGNVGIACLMLKRWKEGWVNYDSLLRPSMLRREITYTVDGEKLPRWNGEPGGEVIVFDEQGIGDALLFASMIPDVIAGGTTPIIDCDKRLAGLFRRSFDCPVYPTRNVKGAKDWVANHKPKAAIAIGSLGRLYRGVDADFPRKPYLKADPVRRAMYRAMLDQWPGRKIGLAWTGGLPTTRTNDRSVTLETLAPLLDLPGITWVSLQYKGDDPGHGIEHVPFATQSKDYDDTAALVAELDGVVSVTTSAALLAGALGVDCHVLIPEAPTWHWPKHGGEYPWFPLKTYRRAGPSWDDVVRQVKEAIS